MYVAVGIVADNYNNIILDTHRQTDYRIYYTCTIRSLSRSYPCLEVVIQIYYNGLASYLMKCLISLWVHVVSFLEGFPPIFQATTTHNFPPSLQSMLIVSWDLMPVAL